MDSYPPLQLPHKTPSDIEALPLYNEVETMTAMPALPQPAVQPAPQPFPPPDKTVMAIYGLLIVQFVLAVGLLCSRHNGRHCDNLEAIFLWNMAYGTITAGGTTVVVNYYPHARWKAGGVNLCVFFGACLAVMSAKDCAVVEGS